MDVTLHVHDQNGGVFTFRCQNVENKGKYSEVSSKIVFLCMFGRKRGLVLMFVHFSILEEKFIAVKNSYPDFFYNGQF